MSDPLDTAVGHPGDRGGVIAWRRPSPTWSCTLTLGALSLLAVLHVVPLPKKGHAGAGHSAH